MATDSFEAFGVPTYHVTTAIPEPAGDGNVRVWNCHERNGVLIPQCEIIIHPMRLMIAAREVSAVAMRIFAAEKISMEGLHH